MSRKSTTLTALAKLGFTSLSHAKSLLAELANEHAIEPVLPLFASAADPDQALQLLVSLTLEHPKQVSMLLESDDAALRLVQVLGASEGLGEFFRRCPTELGVLATGMKTIPAADYYRESLNSSGRSVDSEEGAWNALRVRYRSELARLTAFDLAQTDPLDSIGPVTAALSDLAGAALDASLAIAIQFARFDGVELENTKLAIIGMGKAGARELNYVSDVDVIFVAEGRGEFSNDKAVQIATSLARQTMRGLNGLATEPPLWEVDANLRPEGQDGVLVRTLESHLAYYDRWAKSWEFQALIKARPIAGDLELGERYVESIAPKVWSSASRENFVEGVQRMRERVTENIPVNERDVQLKLGSGGLRDIEFTIQLLQLVHGQNDDSVRQRDTLSALAALAENSYIGRVEAASFSRDYRFIRLLEHRLQLSRLRRTHLMPRDPDALRILARAAGVAGGSQALVTRWQETRLAVRSLHERLFYRPLLAAAAALPEDGLALSSDQAAARLAAIGFMNPKGAIGHIRAMTTGVSRSSQIQRTLLPVMLEWFAEGTDPDYGLLAFRRLSDDLGGSHWFLRMLRDSSGAAKRLTRVLSGSKFVGLLLEGIPEAAAWFANEDELKPRSLKTLIDESNAIAVRNEDVESASIALRGARRREILRVSLASILGLIDVRETGRALANITEALLTGLLAALRSTSDDIEFAIIGMGRYGGRELGFGSDTDVMYVYRASNSDGESQRQAEQLVARLLKYSDDLRLPLELDINLRPEGKNGPVVRSLESYRAYYERWSLTWEAQALLRARVVAGDAALLKDFERLADSIRFPTAISEQDVREVKRIKARVESERLPKGADPSRHLKLGRGSLSDVEWFVQLLQLQHGNQVPSLRTTSTLDALAAAVEADLVTADDAARLEDAWVFAARARSAMTLWAAKTADVLPRDRQQLEGIARLMGYASGSASVLEDDYLRVTRLARSVFERRFYGVTKGFEPTTG